MNREIISSSVIGEKFSNQDTLRYNPQLDIYLLADGLGGVHHKAGKDCSDFVVHTMYKYLRGMKEGLINGSTKKEYIERFLDKYVLETNQMVHLIGKNTMSRANWGTTLEAGLIHDEVFYGLHVGDSKTIITNTVLSTTKKLTDEDVDMVDYSESYSEIEKQVLISNQDLNNYFGMLDTVEVQLYTHTLDSGDWIVMMSDGISDVVSDEEILKIIQDAPNNKIIRGLNILSNSIFGSRAYSIEDEIHKIRETPRQIRNAYESLSEKGFNYDIEKKMGDNASFIIIGGR